MNLATESMLSLWWGWMTSVSIQLVWLFGVVFLLDRILRRWAWPQLRAALWFILVLKLVLPPSLYSPVSVIQIVPDAVLPGEVPSAAALSFSTLFILWLFGAILFAAFCLRRYRRVRYQWLHGVIAGLPPNLEEIAELAKNQIGLRSLPQIKVHSGGLGPGVIGFVKPTVVLPADLVFKGKEIQVRHVLLHEFAHIKRRDPWAHLGCLLLQFVYWFHPVVWIARARLSTLRELCCDQTVARVLRSDTSDYRRTILTLAVPDLPRQSFGAIGFFHRHSQLLARLEWLERPHAPRPHLRRFSTALLAAFLLICCVPLAQPIVPLFVLPNAEQIREFDGCLQKRYAVFGLLAEHEAAQAQTETRP